MKPLATSADACDQYQKEQPNSAQVARSKAEFEKILQVTVSFQDSHLRQRIEQNIACFADEFARADVLALNYQKCYLRASLAIYLLSAFAVIIVAAQHIFHLHHLVAALEALAMIFILWLLFRGSRVGWHRRWLDYRFLAERIRYGFYLAVLVQQGDPNVGKSLPCRWTGESWCLAYFLGLWARRPPLPPLLEVDIEALKVLINRTWLENQRRYHQDKKARMDKKHRMISNLSWAFFGMTLVAAFLHLGPVIFHSFHLDVSLPAEQAINPSLTFLAIAFPTLAATCTGLRAHFDFNKTADRSRMMVTSLEHLQKELAESRDIQKITKVVIEAESLMIQENSDWYINVGLHKLEAA